MKKILRLLFVVTAYATLLIGCGKAVDQTTDVSTNASVAKELTVGIPNDFGPINLYTESEDWINEMVYDKLMASSPYIEKPIPWLAEKVTKENDTTWTVVVRDGIKWQDNQKFTAEDVKFTYEYYRDGAQNRYTHHVNEVPSIKAIDIAKDGKTLTFTCEYACPQLDTITFADLPILPEHIWKGVENPRKVTELAIGTGPYKLTEYKAGDHYTLQANTDYFKGEPTVSKINLPIISDSTAMFNALKTGEIDISKRTVPTELESSLLSSDFKLAKVSALSIVQLGMNFTKEPFADETFRAALSNAINQDALVKTVGSGVSGVEGYPHKDSPWTNPTNKQPFDQNAAITAFDKLGYKDLDGDSFRENQAGKKVTFKLIVASNEPIYVRVAELIKKQLADVGFDVHVKAEEPTTFAADSNDKNYDLYVSLIGPHGAADPDQFIMSNRSGYLWTKDLSYPAMDSLQKEWEATSTAEARKAVSFKLQTLYNAQPTAISLYYPEAVYAYNAKKYDGYVETLGFGIINKYSFLSRAVQKEVSTTTPDLLSK
ncbi:ABC transporter substrate-binding protein [Kurthia sibirica]|uniref:ABC transporter substrate-binding protein n=1 Tax=Kurthia sibirica TaxID=202750 RepID=A0A2U3AJR2_9BACL|nr:ABC transporter substrate-binding protein [Kurthia sibirica]PWI24783.1 ABC transporter substrate-binding protein [Kurthia sibirica]GEK34886.1 diguanylate phosphodiesterase [Kurthia sibirica]